MIVQLPEDATPGRMLFSDCLQEINVFSSKKRWVSMIVQLPEDVTQGRMLFSECVFLNPHHVKVCELGRAMWRGHA